MDDELLVPPDIETSSTNYSRRFTGAVGSFFLETQAEHILSLLRNSETEVRILEVGGGHCQLTEYFLKRGYKVWVHGSSEAALVRAQQLAEQYPQQCFPFVSSFFELPFAEKHFNVVIAIRLLCHLNRWEKAVDEMCRVCKSQIIVDFPPQSSFNIFYPILFRVKHLIEGDTRPFIRFNVNSIVESFNKRGFSSCEMRREFFLPMAFHRLLRKPRISKRLEKICYSRGLTNLFGSPVILSVQELLQIL